MRRSVATAVTVLAATVATAHAQEHRDLGAHEHGVGTLNMAIEGSDVAMMFEAPGADIVGFEHAATSDADKAAVADALATLQDPMQLFVLPADAGCSLLAASASLVTDDAHEEEHAAHRGHDEDHHAEEHASHDDHDEDHHGEEHASHDDHDEDHHGEEHASHDDHDEDHHAEEHASHDDHDDDHHGEEHASQDDHDEDHHGEEHASHDVHDEDHHGEEHAAPRHTEFQAEYMLSCEQPQLLTEVAFAYFERFSGAQTMHVNVIDDGGAHAFTVKRADPHIRLGRSS